MSEHRVPPAVEKTLEHLQDMGLSPSLVERFVSWWRRFGIVKAIVFIAAITLPLWRFVWIPHTLSAAVGSLAESYGSELAVEDWSSNWGDIAVSGEHIVLRTPGGYSNEHLLEAEAIELDWNLMRGMGNAYRRLTSRVLFREPPPDEPVHALRLRRATLHLERLLSGRWNVHDAIRPQTVDWDQVRRVRIPAIDAEDLRIVWMEHLPADSGGGLIEQKTASLFLDDVRLAFRDVMLPDDARPNATEFSLDGRTADGVFSVKGTINLTHWSEKGGITNASAVSARRWAPTFDVSMYLENIGAAAFARMVSDASLLPSAGTMTGRIQVAVDQAGALKCHIDVRLRNVEWTPNPRSHYVRVQQAEIERGVRGLVVNEHVNKACSPADWEEPQYRFVKALQADITGDALRSAPPIVQGAAGYDRLRFIEHDEAALAKFTSDMSAKIGAALGGESGAAVARALTASDAPNGGNPVTRGLRSVGRGIKRIFGGGGQPKKK